MQYYPANNIKVYPETTQQILSKHILKLSTICKPISFYLKNCPTYKFLALEKSNLRQADEVTYNTGHILTLVPKIIRACHNSPRLRETN